MILKLAPSFGVAIALALAACSPAAEKAEAPAAAPTAPRLTVADLPAPYNQADLANGEAGFAICRNCHTLPAGAPDMMGPNLHGVFQRAPGGKTNFRYSEAMTTFSHATVLKQWPPEEIDKWLADPAAYMPGSAMRLNGITDANTRRDIIAFVMVQTTE
jgi:cytochrome c